jgi:hypothetical protein
MTPRSFLVRSSKHYERLARLLYKQQPKFAAVQESAVEIPEHDPTKPLRSSRYQGAYELARGEGQWRIAVGRFRFRYDIYDQDVALHYCGLRREDTYRST